MNLFSKLKTKSSSNLEAQSAANNSSQQPNIDIKNIESKLDTILSQQNEILTKQQRNF